MPPPSKRPRTGAQASILGFISSSKAETFSYSDGAATWAAGAPLDAVDPQRRWSATVKLRTPFDRTLTLATAVGDAPPASFYKETSAYHMGSVSLVKSHLQKAVRRMDARRAMASTMELLRLAPDELLRRLPIIVLEDVGPAAWLPGMIWLMCAHSKGYRLRDTDVAFLLGAVRQLCECGRRARRAEPGTGPPKGLPPPGESTTLQLSLMLRALYGGMEGDVQMCFAYGSTQSAAQPLPELAVQPPRVEPSSVPPLRVDDWILEAVDFHCSSVCQVLRLRCCGALGGVSEDELRRWMWSSRAGVNTRCSSDGRAVATHEDPSWAKFADAHRACDNIAREIIAAHTVAVLHSSGA